MKRKTVDKVVLIYKLWSVTLLVIFIFMASYRLETFYTWWISTVFFMMYLLINILHLANLKKKLSEDRLREAIYLDKK